MMKASRRALTNAPECFDHRLMDQPPGTSSRQLRQIRRLPGLFMALLSLVGCQSNYTRLAVTNPRGERIADWVAVGPIIPLERGYRIKAVERLSGPPHPILTRYPDGWRTTVVGPNIHHWRCPAPAWLYEDDDDRSAQAR